MNWTGLTDPGKVVLTFMDALNQEHYGTARNYVWDNLEVEEVWGTYNGADTYFREMQKMGLKFEPEKVFVSGDDVCLLYNSSFAEIQVFACGWYRVSGGKIKALRTVFDPRSLLEVLSRNKPPATSSGAGDGGATAGIP